MRTGEPLGSKVFMLNDVSRAFFEAPAKRNICIEMPKEDMTESDIRHGKVGHLRMSLYGTRDASPNWQQEVAKEMRGWGFSRGTYNPCLYFQKERGLRTFLHGDDFAAVGTIENVTWLKALLAKRFEIKTECISPAAAGVVFRKVGSDLGAPSLKPPTASR